MRDDDGNERKPHPATKARGGEIVRSPGQFRYLLAVFVALVVAALAVLFVA